MNRAEIEKILKDYHWMINSIKIMRESFFSNNLVDQDSFSVYKIDEILSEYNIGRGER